MNGDTLQEVVTKLVGPVFATGSHDVDVERLKNLRLLISMIDSEIDILILVSKDSSRYQESMKAIGKEALEALESIHENIGNYLEEVY